MKTETQLASGPSNPTSTDMPKRLACPECKGHDIHRSQRRGAIERFFKFAITPWRCHSCDHRFRRLGFATPTSH